MLKSWKLRAAVAGVALVAAPMALMGSAGAQTVPLAPTGVTVTPVNGPPGTSVTATATGCGTAAAPATSGVFFLTGPTITTPAPGQAFPGTVSAGQVLTGTVTIPAAAREGDQFTINARCDNASGQGQVSTIGATFTTTAPGLLTTTGGTTLTGITGGLTGTTGATTGTTATTGGTTTGVAQPIPQQPTFTG